MSEKERWRPALGYEGWYEVSDHGRLRRIKEGMGSRGGLLRPSLNRGYPIYHLSKLGETDVIPAHTLVAEAFIGPRPEGYIIHHRDFDRGNPRLENLEYIPRAEGLRRTQKSLDDFQPRGEQSGRAVLNEVQVRTARRIHPTWGYAKLARWFGVHPSTIKAAVEGRSWPHVTDDGPVLITLIDVAEGR